MSLEHTIKYLSDYKEPNYLVNHVNLTFEILTDKVIVINSAIYTNHNTDINSLILNGSSKLLSLKLNNKTIEYKLHNDELTLDNLPSEFELEVITEVDAFNNKSCMGLYASNGSLFTQNEPEGFRKITYYQDRPDVMATFTTTIIADINVYPIMLSNGNKISEEILANNLHKTVWEDPFKKPSYLFALVAGKFEVLQEYYTTKSGHKVLLEVYSDKSSINQCQHCIDSLRRAMEWDENRFDLEYDLERYMIVASNDFNMGAMENKGLNIFNTKYVLADSKTATDVDFINVEAVVGHEYFHNWTGNRVTCRDWFQLSLKEGLTVFRDQEFTADLHARTVKRIQDVKLLKQNQFPEDASSLAHPIRPSSYMEINNFYTVTIYEKGAEVVRMYQTILGKDGFNKGMKLYFERHDGTAATCNDFCNAMADANNTDLSQFMLWYSQAGTPSIDIIDSYDLATQIYRLELRQNLPSTPDTKDKKEAMLIPIEFGFLDNAGHELNIEIVSGNLIKPEQNYIMLLDQKCNIFEFKLTEKPTPSFLRNFSAPVNINYNYTTKQIINIAINDNNLFNRWEAIQHLYKEAIKGIYYDVIPNDLITNLITAITTSLNDENIAPSIKALLVGIPSFAEIVANYKPANAHNLVNAISELKNTIANSLESLWLKTYQNNQTTKYSFIDAGNRSLKNIALLYLMNSNNFALYLDIVEMQYDNSDNMTDKIGVLFAINDISDDIRSKLLSEFASKYKNYPLVMDKWFALQAQSQVNNTGEIVENLVNSPYYDANNPNKIYSLIRTFACNQKMFNTKFGYEWIANEIIRISKFNPNVAGRVASCFSIINSLDDTYKSIAKPVLEKIIASENISSDVYEIVSKTLTEI
ncbi:MAG: aminopeptidase N [Burkholderiales bacterium]|nr:aminopeptidase N [Burkholderiales bacterium]